MYIEVPSLEFEELRERPNTESSAEIRARVNAARAIQQKRYTGTGTGASPNGSKLWTSTATGKDCERLMKDAYDRRLTARSYDRILRVARTIADLASSDTMKQHWRRRSVWTYDFRDRNCIS